jgi:hypothetical protein
VSEVEAGLQMQGECAILNRRVETGLDRFSQPKEKRWVRALETKHYRIALYDSASVMEYNGDEHFTFSYLRTRFKSETAARQVLDEVQKNGTADRQFESPLGGNFVRDLFFHRATALFANASHARDTSLKRSFYKETTNVQNSRRLLDSRAAVPF